MVIGPVEHKINIRFRNMDDLGSFINAIDIDYDNEGVTFTGYLYKLNTPQFKVVQRSAIGKGTNYMKDIVEYKGQNCYKPTSGLCFIKCNSYFIYKDHPEEIREIIRNEKNRSVVMTSASNQLYCNKYDVNVGCFDTTRINLQKITQKTQHYSYTIIICLI